MKLEISCAMCCKEKTLEIDTEGFKPDTTVRRLIENAKWIVQVNGEHFDIYCSKRCAA